MLIRVGWVSGLVAAAFFASACTMLESEPAPPCPNVSVIKDTAKVTKFLPGVGRDLIDVVYEGTFQNPTGMCEYDVDDDTGEGNLAVELLVTMELARGPANKDRKAEVAYFVSITDSERRILNKQNFSGVVAFPGNKNRLQWTDEPVYLRIPLKGGKTGTDFSIYVGFGVTPDQLKFNRKQIEGARRK